MITISNKFLNNRIKIFTKDFDYNLIYITHDFEVIERNTLKSISDTICCCGNITLYTNAGVDIHSSEKNNLFGITIKRIKYSDLDNILNLIS